MKEDLIETVTNLILRGNVYRIIFIFFRLETQNEEKELLEKFKSFVNVKPEGIDIPKQFRLDESSEIEEMFEN